MARPTWPLAAVLSVLALSAPAAAESPETPRSICHGKGWVDYLVVHGRLTVRGVRPGINLNCAIEDTANSRHESYSATATASAVDRPDVRYELSTPSERLEVEFHGGVQARITREPRGTATFAKIVLDQPADGPLKLKVGEGLTARQVVAASFWHLAILEPAIFAEALAPALETQRCDWALGRQSDLLHTAIVNASAQPSSCDADRFSRLLSQLAVANFGERRAAERELRGLGAAALPYLRDVDRSNLAAESKWFLRQWQGELARSEADTPQRVASWLAADRGIWIRLLADGSPDEKAAAAQWLASHAGPTAERPALSGRE